MRREEEGKRPDRSPWGERKKRERGREDPLICGPGSYLAVARLTVGWSLEEVLAGSLGVQDHYLIYILNSRPSRFLMAFLPQKPTNHHTTNNNKTHNYALNKYCLNQPKLRQEDLCGLSVLPP